MERWTHEEIERFTDAVRTYGNDYKKIVEIVGTKTYKQVERRIENVRKQLKRGDDIPNFVDLSILLERKQRK